MDMLNKDLPSYPTRGARPESWKVMCNNLPDLGDSLAERLRWQVFFSPDIEHRARDPGILYRNSFGIFSLLLYRTGNLFLFNEWLENDVEYQ